MAGVHLPADVELEDRLAFGLTGRQLVLLVASALLAYGVESLLALALPLPLALAAALLCALGGGALALVRRDGLAGPELALAFLRFTVAPRLLVPAPDGLPLPLPGPGRRVAALEPPVARIHGSGLVELADGSHCRLLEARGTSFSLRDPAEQAAFVAAFGRLLNGLAGPLQIQVARQRASLEPLARELEAGARGLPQALAAAAADHARYLRGLAAGEQPLMRRRILVVLRSLERRGEPAEGALARSAQQAAELLGAAGVTLRAMPGPEAAALLAEAFGLRLPDGCELEGVIHARTPQP